MQPPRVKNAATKISKMAKSDFDPFIIDVRRQIVSIEDQMEGSADIHDIYMEAFSGGLEYDGDVMEGYFTSLSEYTRGELKLLSKFLGKSRLNFLEIEGVQELDWAAILNNGKSELDELRVTIKSPRALADLATSLCDATSLSTLELNYFHPEDDSQDEEAEERSDENHNSSTCEISNNLSLNETFFEALMPLKHVVLRGITPITPSSSTLIDDLGLATTCSWQHLTIEDCDLNQENSKWLPPCITSLEEIVINNCELSGATIQILSEAYLTATASRRRCFSRKSSGERRRKNPLRILNLSNNDWLLPLNDGNDEVVKESFDDVLGDEGDLYSNDCHWDQKAMLSPQSCTSFLASWLDSLSNLVELDLSNNPQLFQMDTENGIRGMNDLCGTVNQSLKRLSLRNNYLEPDDLHQIVNTFCWLEALDVSENPAVISNISQLAQLEYLKELVLEDLITYDTMETFEFERRLSDEEFDWETGQYGLTGLLLDLLNGENDNYSTMRGIRRRRKKPLERLNLSGNIIGKKTLKMLSLFSSLEVLILMGCQINDNGIIQLLDGANNCSPRRSSLREVYLASNTIGDIGIMALAQSIKDQRLPQLKVLNLESNAISVDAFRIFVEEGLVYSTRLQYAQVSDHGAITCNQQLFWKDVRERMEHHLLLNQAGRFSLFVDGNFIMDDEDSEEVFEDYFDINEGNNELQKNKISTSLWPLILENADSIYGTDALFYFLHKRPDLFLASHKNQVPTLYQPTPIKTAREVVSSPNGVEDIASFL